MLVALIAAVLAVAAVDPGPIVAAERAFAADGDALGVKASFLKYATEDSVIVTSRPARTRDLFRDAPDEPPGASRGKLVWWPLWAGIANSGDLGFTTGPVERSGVRGGHYFTVWKKQPDGAWKWVYDGGPPADSAGQPAKGAPVAYLAAATGHAASAQAAWREVRAAERALAAAAAKDQKAAHLAALAPDARLYVLRRPPATTPAEVRAALATYPKTFAFGPPQGGEASQGGDLAYAYGPVAWPNAAAGSAGGYYVHVWQNRAGVWKLVYSHMLAADPSPPPPANG